MRDLPFLVNMGRIKKLRIVCKICKVEKDRELFPMRSKGIRKGDLLDTQCIICWKKGFEVAKKKLRSYRRYKQDICAICGFKGLPCQLDINHIDMNHKNNNLENLETLCANCHRLVTFIMKRGNI